MTRQEWKERLPLITAFAEGKRVQTKIGASWIDVIEALELTSPVSGYRIAPEPTYRPWRPEEVPVGEVVKSKDTPCRYVILASLVTCASLAVIGRVSYGDILDLYIMADGSPCGAKEGGE